jgi:hypothetical protein
MTNDESKRIESGGWRMDYSRHTSLLLQEKGPRDEVILMRSLPAFGR